jgi:glutathione synthase/RimK-type ligase-like ATP-grasp enzyme
MSLTSPAGYRNPKSHDAKCNMAQLGRVYVVQVAEDMGGLSH